jgi:uncharacterized tellurite resistance protein B-like protein
MIDRIKAFLERGARPAQGARRHAPDEFQAAAAALLVEVAIADGQCDAAERARILAVVERRFGLSREEAAALVGAAEGEVGRSAQILRFTRAIKDAFVYDERVRLMEMLWEVVYADGVLDAHEDQLMRRIGGLIYVSDRDRGVARKRALARAGRGLNPALV